MYKTPFSPEDPTAESIKNAIPVPPSAIPAEIDSLVNLRSLNSKIKLQKYPDEERFKVITTETPRDTPFYLKDLKRIFNRRSIRERLQNTNFDSEADQQDIIKKALSYYKKQKEKCSKTRHENKQKPS